MIRTYHSSPPDIQHHMATILPSPSPRRLVPLYKMGRLLKSGLIPVLSWALSWGPLGSTQGFDCAWVRPSTPPSFTSPSADFTRTYSNNCVEVFDVLKTEAAATAHAAIIEELRNVIEFNIISCLLLTLSSPLPLCDLMTRPLSIIRHRINHTDTGPLTSLRSTPILDIIPSTVACPPVLVFSSPFCVIGR